MTPQSTAIRGVPAPPLQALGLSQPELDYFVFILQCAERQAAFLRNVALSTPAMLVLLWICDTQSDVSTAHAMGGIADQVVPLASIAFPVLLLLCIGLFGGMQRQMRLMVDTAPLHDEARALLRTTLSAMGLHVWTRMFHCLRRDK